MTTVRRPAAVRIDDLADPVFPAEIQPIIDAMAEMGAALRLESDALLQAAVETTGLDDFGDGVFRERLDVLCSALRTEAGLNPAGVTAAWGMLTQLLTNRLRVEDLWRRHPEIGDVEIARPIVICGLPRTGTTHLHNLISADAALRSLPYWESVEPVLAEGAQPGPGEPDPRWARTEQSLAFINGALPYFQRMHEMTVDHVHEEIQLLALDFSTMLFETMAPMPTWREYYKAIDQTPVYAYLRRILQALTWLRGGTRWVLKSPQHLEQFRALITTFPDATFVVTHRDPVSVTASLATMITYSSRLSHARVDPVTIGHYWADRVEDKLRACVETREVLPASQSIDVRFTDFMANDVGMVERIYALAGQPFTPDSRQAMDGFMASHPRGKFGAVRYDLADFGLDPGERRKALDFYIERFAVEVEQPGT